MRVSRRGIALVKGQIIYPVWVGTIVQYWWKYANIALFLLFMVVTLVQIGAYLTRHESETK